MKGFRLFCESCAWSVFSKTDRPLWHELARCPVCGSFTDGLPVK